MKLQLCLNWLIFISATIAIGQDRSFATLPIIQSETVTGDMSDDLNGTEDFKRLVKIYNDLVRARGDSRLPVPKLFLRDVRGMVASIDHTKNEITMEKQAFDVCKQFGDAGIAFLLGHELTHYYEKHAWKESFLQENALLDNDDAGNIIKRLKSIQDGVAHETEADYLGGFLCYTAGYGIFEDGGQLIQDLYAAYGLPDTLELYPALPERVALGERSAKKLKTLIRAFQMANYLYLLGQYELSYEYYDYVARNYQSREVYNNLGVVSTLTAMSYLDPKALKFKYVTELDVSLQGSRNVSVPKEVLVKQALEQAIMHFNAAINLDPTYAPAYLNKANAYALQKEWRKAEFYLDVEAMEVAMKDTVKFNKTLQDIRVLQGIIAAESGDMEQAREFFGMASSSGSRLAKHNLSVLEAPTPNPAPTTTAESQDFTRLKLGSLSARSFLNRLPKVRKLASVGIDHQFLAHLPSDGKTEVLVNRNFTSGMLAALLITTDDFDSNLDSGIHIGSSTDAVVEVYGEPKAIVESTQGSLLVYDNCIFNTNDNRVVKIVTCDFKKL